MFRYSTICFALFFLLLGCKKEPSNYTYEISRVKHTYLASYQYLFKQFDDSLSNLQFSIGQFNAVPIITRFNAAKDAWRGAYRSFLHVKPFMLMSGSLENPYLYNRDVFDYAHFDLSFLDYTVNVPGGGIVNDVANYPAISPAVLAAAQNPSLNQYTQGLHVIEFMLWGEDFSTNSPGARAHYDYSNNSQADRRKLLLGSVSGLLGQTVDQQSYSSSFEQRILQMDGKEFMQYLLSGLVNFTEKELGEQMLYMPYSTGDMHKEVSKFSDNTWQDILSSLEAITYLLDGGDIYIENGYTLADLFGAIDPEKLDEIYAAIEKCRSLVDVQIYDFDYCVFNASERETIKTFYDEVKVISEGFRYFAQQLDITL